MESLVRTCKTCGKWMANSPFLSCEDCLADSEKVRAYIKNQESVTPNEIAAATNVPLEKVTAMIRRGSMNA